MGRMTALGLPALAATYKDLSHTLVEHELNRYVPIFRALSTTALTRVPIPMQLPVRAQLPIPTSSSLGLSDTHLAMDVDSQNEDFSSTSGTGEPAGLVWPMDEDGFLQLE